MAVAMSDLIADLRAESADLQAMIDPLPVADWERPTPAEGWAVRDQISHLAWFDDAAVTALTDPDGFRAGVPAMLARGAGRIDEIAAEARLLPAPEVREWFVNSRARALAVFGETDPKARVPWFGPDMSAVSFVTARLMETWAHGQDVADALGLRRVPTDRLRHVAVLGVRALPYSFAVRGMPVPGEPIRVELALPGGEPWEHGPAGAPDAVRGTALDFCLVVTQRRHVADTSLSVTGPVAEAWISVAQAFAGPPGKGRAPRSRDARAEPAGA